MTTLEIRIPDSRDFLKGLPWILVSFLLTIITFLLIIPFFSLFMEKAQAEYAACIFGPLLALQVCLHGLAENWPFHQVKNRWAKGFGLLVLSLVCQVLFILVLHLVFQVDLVTWGFPIVATLWLFIAATSFVGGDAHLPDVKPTTRTLMNLIIAIGGTSLILNTINWFPAYWFCFLQILMVTGGAAYYFRKVKQPIFSICVWALLFGLMWLAQHIASWIGGWETVSTWADSWTWSYLGFLNEIGVWFAVACGLTFAGLQMVHCWPFSRLRQPWATPVAGVVVFALCALIAWLAIVLTQLLYPTLDYALVLWYAQVLAWQLVGWTFVFVYSFQAGMEPYLWVGQKTPGTWADVD